MSCPTKVTCWGALVAHWGAGAAAVLIGGLGGEAQWAASSHVVHVVVRLIHHAGEPRRHAMLAAHVP